MLRHPGPRRSRQAGSREAPFNCSISLRDHEPRPCERSPLRPGVQRALVRVQPSAPMIGCRARGTHVKTDLSAALFSLDPYIRYVAVNQSGTITEMEQRAEWPSNNPPETDRLEELIVNPLVLEAARRRGDLDLGGVRYVIIRYGMQYLPVRRGTRFRRSRARGGGRSSRSKDRGVPQFSLTANGERPVRQVTPRRKRRHP
jgi:hypothetical protein